MAERLGVATTSDSVVCARLQSSQLHGNPHHRPQATCVATVAARHHGAISTPHQAAECARGCGPIFWALRSCQIVAASQLRSTHKMPSLHVPQTFASALQSWRSGHSFRAQQSRTEPGFTWWWCEPMILELVMGMTAGDAGSVRLGRVSEIQVMLRCLCLVVAECDRTGHQCRRSPP